MIIIMKEHAKKSEIQAVKDKVIEFGFKPHVITGEVQSIIGAVGSAGQKEQLKALISWPGVEKVMPIQHPYKLASRSVRKKDSCVMVNNIQIGGGTFVVMGGPCAVETMEQTRAAAECVRQAGGHFLRGGAYKPRTSPYSFQGLREEGLKILAQAKAETGLGVVTELINNETIDVVAQYADLIQIGARNMQNFALLQAVGKLNTPILLKRGMSATIEEWLMSAEYIMSEGNYNVILCERGIRTFETAYRNTLDLNAVPTLKRMSHLPVIVDPSHGTGHRDMVIPMAKAAIGAGADGIIVEVHPRPECSVSDADQTLSLAEFEQLMAEIKPFVKAAGKTLVQL